MSKEVKQREGTGTWVTDFRYKGERVRRSLDARTEDEAELEKDKLKVLLQSAPSFSGVSWFDAQDKWVNNVEDGETRHENDLLSLRLFNLHYSDRLLSDVTVENLTAALDVIAKKKKWKHATYNRYLNRLVAICNLSKLSLSIDKKPVGKKGERTFVLTLKQWITLQIQLPAHMRPMVELALYTGMRQMNILQLRWDHVDLKRQVLWIDADAMKEEEAVTIPLCDQAVTTLRSQRGKSSEWVFPYGPRKAPVSNINHAWHLAMERADLGRYERWTTADGKRHEKWHGVGLTWHGLRHTWASWQRLGGTSPQDLQAMGAWRDPRSMARYSHTNVEHLRKAANNAKPWEPSNDSEEIESVTKAVTK